MTKNYHIYWIKECESTNSEAQNRLLNGSDDSANLSVIAAESQTAGRGQGDHKWHTAPGLNLTFTIILRFDAARVTCGRPDAAEDASFPAFPAIRQKEISDMVAGSVVSYLAEKGIDAWIKQPNDVYVGKKKICGMLIKHRVSGASLLYTIAGIGININETEFPSDLPNPTSVAVELGDGVVRDLKKELQNYLEHFVSAAEKLFLSPASL